MSHKEHTSKRVARIAGKTLSDPKSTKRERSLAGTALTQTRNRKGRKH